MKQRKKKKRENKVGPRDRYQRIYIKEGEISKRKSIRGGLVLSNPGATFVRSSKRERKESTAIRMINWYR